MNETNPKILVFTMTFPHPGQPNAGVFIRERMYKVGQHLPVVVVAPVPWFPLQSLIRRWKPYFRPDAPRLEVQNGITVHHPKFLSVPGLLKGLDGLFMALGSYRTVAKLKKDFGFTVSTPILPIQTVTPRACWENGWTLQSRSRCAEPK